MVPIGVIEGWRSVAGVPVGEHTRNKIINLHCILSMAPVFLHITEKKQLTV